MNKLRGDVSDYFTVHEYGKTSSKKVYLFGWWGARTMLFRPLIRELTGQGYACVLFIPKSRLIAIGTPYTEIVKAAHLVTEEVLHRIQIDKMVGVRDFVSFGISFGTIFAMELTKQSREVMRLVLLSPFGDFARHVELWPKHRYFSRVLASQPMPLTESGSVLNKVGALQNIVSMKGKSVLVCYSKKDRIIHTDVTEEMVRTLNNSGVSAEAVIVPGGHLRGIIHHLIIRKAYKKFLAVPVAGA